METGQLTGAHRGVAHVVATPDHRTRGVIIGGLLVFAIVVLFVGEALYKALLESPDRLSTGEHARVVLGILIEFTAVPAVILVAALLYPVLRPHSESLAIAYVGVRVLEGAVLSLAYVAQLSRLDLAEPDGPGSAAAGNAVEPLDQVLRSVADWAGTTGLLYLVPFCLGALVLFAVLYQACLVPRPIAGWGLLSALALLTGAVLANLDLLGAMPGAGLEVAFAAPIAIAELLLAGWLITRGFTVGDPRS